MIRLDHSALLVIVMAVLGTAHLLARTSTYGAAVDSRLRDPCFGNVYCASTRLPPKRIIS